MAGNSVKDWQADAEVVKSRGARDRAAELVAECETAHTSARHNEILARIALQAAESLLAQGGGSLRAVSEAATRVAECGAAVHAAQMAAGPRYSQLSDAERDYQEAVAAAQRAAWPSIVTEYKRLAGEMDQALTAVLAVQDRAEALHKDLLASYGCGAGGWLSGPDGQRLPSLSFRTHRLSQLEVGTWRTFQSDLLGAGGKARKAVADLRQLLAAA